MIPAGCVEANTCDGAITCYNCLIASGPASGCYWDPALSGACWGYWSSSRAASEFYAWCVNFYSAYVFDLDTSSGYQARCVREQ